MKTIENVAGSEVVEQCVVGDKGTIRVQCHVDSEGFPVVNIILEPEEGFMLVATDVDEVNGTDIAKTAPNGQLQVTFIPCPEER